MPSIMEIAARHNLLVVEDCAQSHGSAYAGKMLGTFGHVGCFSFYPTKGLGAFGEGGAIVTDDAALAERFRMFRNYGSREHYRFEVVGTNSRLDELQAGLLNVKLRHLEEINQERRMLAERYNMGIRNPRIHLPKVRPEALCTWHQYVIHLEQRDALAQWLKQAGVGTNIHYPIPPHRSEAYASLNLPEGTYPIAERYAREVLSLPMYNGMTEEEQAYVIDRVNLFGE